MRERIIAVAIQAMEELGIRFTMSDLAARLAVSKRTLYEYFHSKEELIDAIVDFFLAELDQQAKKIINDESLTLIDKIKSIPLIYPRKFGPHMDRILGDIQHYMPDKWGRFERYLKEFWRLFEDVLGEAIAANHLRPVNLVIIQMIFNGLTDQLFDYKYLAQNNLTINAAMEMMGDIVLYGLIVPTEKVNG